MFELMLNFGVAAPNMRTHASLRSQSLSLLPKDIDTSAYLPLETEASSSSIGSNGDAWANNSVVHMSARKQRGKFNANKILVCFLSYR
jgi:hypothetical protein